MIKNKIKLLLFLIVVLNSCQTIKDGLTGQKQNNSDEFLVTKKNRLEIPPDFDKLPTPDERAIAFEEMSSFEKTLGTVAAEESISSSSSSSNEESIINQIRKK